MGARNLPAAAISAIAFGCVVGGVAGCSAQAHSAVPPLGTLNAGTAHVVLGDHDLGQTDSVRCLVTPPLITITTGDATAGSTTVVSSAGPLLVESVQIHQLDGFTGSYYADLMGRAEVGMTGSTYSIAGRAEGFTTDDASLAANRTFSIKVAC